MITSYLTVALFLVAREAYKTYENNKNSNK